MSYSIQFSESMLCASTTALRKGIDNSIPASLQPNAMRLSIFLALLQDALFAKFGKKFVLRVSSAYRCLKLNTAVGGSKTSDHMDARAADLTCDGMTPKQLFDFIRAEIHGCKQVILEFNSWVHVSILTESTLEQTSYLIAKKSGSKTIYEVA